MYETYTIDFTGNCPFLNRSHTIEVTCKKMKQVGKPAIIKTIGFKCSHSSECGCSNNCPIDMQAQIDIR